MKLKKLHIAEYKNLNDFNLDFESGNGLTILIGNNGSGKSNVLEAISAIFANAYAAKPLHQFVYSLSYEINGKKVALTRTIYRCQYYVEGKVVSAKSLAQDGYLPTNVIALYSGEDKRWWHEYYEPFYTQYVRKIEAGVPHTPAPKMYYVNKYYWDIALLTLIYSMADDDKVFLKNKIGIETVDHILLFYGLLGTQKCKSELLKSFLDTTNALSTFGTEENGDPVFLYGMQNKDIFSTYGIHVNKSNAATKDWFLFTDAKFFANRPEEGFNYLEKEVFDFLAQAYMPKGKKVIKDIEIICNGYSAKHLSEGEKKLILIRAILSFVADENSLILFDEPDANIHESRKQDLYHLYLEFSKFNRQMVIASHSPTFVDIAEIDQLRFLRQSGNGDAVIIEEEKIDAIRNLTGSRNNAFLEKPILYCEGTETSIESTLYPILFPDYKVIPSGGHEEVINNTKAYNRTFGDDIHKAIGIIDWDYKSDRQIASLKEDKVYALKVVEIENVLMDLTLIEAAKERFCAGDGSVDIAKEFLFNECSRNKEKQAAKYTSNRIIIQIKDGLTPEGRDIEKFKQNLTKIANTDEIDALYSERLNELDHFIQDSCFSELVSIYDFNHNIDRFLNAIVNQYKDRILRLIQSQGDLQRFIREKYYSDIR